jgi:hypothetical protein
VPEWMAWLEGSALGHFVRESGRWTYAIVNLSHVFGIALLFGAITVLDLKLLGAWRGTPMHMLARPIVPVAATGLALALVSGITLLSAQATEYVSNPFLYIKFAAIALGIGNLALLHSSAVWRRIDSVEASSGGRRRLAIGGALSLACWILAIGAGRMIAYW